MSKGLRWSKDAQREREKDRDRDKQRTLTLQPVCKIEFAKASGNKCIASSNKCLTSNKKRT